MLCALYSLPSVIRALLSPHLPGELADHAKLRPLLVLGENVALLGRSEAALRRQAELLERREFGGFLDATLYVVLLLQGAALRRDQAENDHLVALGQKSQRLEPAGALGIVFEEIAVVVAATEQILRDRL